MGRTGWDHARFARIPAGKKQQGAALQPAGAEMSVGRNGHGGSARAPRLTHCSWPQTP